MKLCATTTTNRRARENEKTTTTTTFASRRSGGFGPTSSHLQPHSAIGRIVGREQEKKKTPTNPNQRLSCAVVRPRVNFLAISIIIPPRRKGAAMPAAARNITIGSVRKAGTRDGGGKVHLRGGSNMCAICGTILEQSLVKNAPQMPRFVEKKRDCIFSPQLDIFYVRFNVK